MAISKIIYKTSPQDTGTVWMDATPATAAASDITAPKTAMLADGVLTTGTGSGGGGGLEYETGTWTPTLDTHNANISFSTTHTSRPMYAMIQDVTDATGSTASDSSVLSWFITDMYDTFGIVYYSSTSAYYGRTAYAYKSSNSGIWTGSGYTNETALEGVLTASEIVAPFTNSYWWRAGRTYKWIAVWAPSA